MDEMAEKEERESRNKHNMTKIRVKRKKSIYFINLYKYILYYISHKH